MRELLYFINGCFYVYFNSDDSLPEEMAPPWKTGTLDTHEYNYDLYLAYIIWKIGIDYVCR